MISFLYFPEIFPPDIFLIFFNLHCLLSLISFYFLLFFAHHKMCFLSSCFSLYYLLFYFIFLLSLSLPPSLPLSSLYLSVSPQFIKLPFFIYFVLYNKSLRSSRLMQMFYLTL
uniref:Uncharacterized protein n=1 Tax=Cacopsylla melanoneura TaxID=428564 RepID=A0A8D9ETY9_9HEMI